MTCSKCDMPQWRIKWVTGCFDSHLSKFFQHQGEDPEVEHDLWGSRAKGRGRAKVQQEHVGEEEEEGKVHDDITEKHSDRSAPEAMPAAQ